MEQKQQRKLKAAKIKNKNRSLNYLREKLNNISYIKHEIFGLDMPTNCPDIPQKILNPINTWSDKDDYITQAKQLAKLFHKNFNSIKSSMKIDYNIDHMTVNIVSQIILLL